MATSNSYNFSIDRDTLIKEALEILNAYDPVSTPSADEIFSCSRTLNMMLRAYQSQGLHLWKLAEVHMFLQTDKTKYTLSPTGDSAVLVDEWYATAIKVAAVATDTTIDVDSTANMTVGDKIGIRMDSGTWHWSTVSSITDSDTVVIADALTAAAAIDNIVRSYTNNVQRPLKIRNAYIRNYTTNSDSSLNILSREEYHMLGVKTQEGTPNQIYFDPRLDSAEVRIYPEPSSTDTDDYIVLICEYPFEDFDTGANTPDFPPAWYEAVVWGLAVRLMYKYGATVTQDRRHEIMAISRNMLEEALSMDNENVSLFMQPHRRYLRR